MTGGSNGTHPIATLGDRQRCPEAPTKRKYRTTDEAWAAARERTAETKMAIAPYACPGCGYFHLTKKATGSDVLTRQGDGSVVTGSQRKHAENHPVYHEAPQRVLLPEPEEDPVPGNRDARLKVARDYLATCSATAITATTDDLMNVLDCSVVTVRSVMAEIGYRNTRGRYAHWVPIEGKQPELSNEDDARIDNMREKWTDITTDRVQHIAIGDLIASYAAAGIRVRVQIER